MTTRRQFIRRTTACGLIAASALPLLEGCSRSKETRKSTRKVMIPTLSAPWAQSTPLFGDVRLPDSEIRDIPIDSSGFASRESSLSAFKDVSPALQARRASIFADFALVQDNQKRWHVISIELRQDTKGAPTLTHHIADRLTGPYRRVEPIANGFPLPADPRERLVMTAPFVIWKNERTAYMYYGHAVFGPDGAGWMVAPDSSIRVLESRDGTLDSWVPRFPQSERRNELVCGPFARDPMILWDEERKTYYMYYSWADGWVESEAECQLRVKTSTDLENWSEHKVLMTPPPGHRAVESAYVIKKDGLYYLWVCGFDWGRMSLYVSEDPLNFGDPAKNRLMEQSGHTPEIVLENGQYWMACAGISTRMGRPWGFCDLLGTYIQPLKWVDASEDHVAKITRA